MALEVRGKYEIQMDKLQLQNGIDLVMKLLSRANKYIDETAPWVLARDEAKKARLATVMFADAATFLTYNANMRQLTYDKLKSCELVVFNRFKPDMSISPIPALRMSFCSFTGSPSPKGTV